MENRLKDAERIIDEMEKENNLSKLEDLIKDNSIAFEHSGKSYRIHLLNLVEKEELALYIHEGFWHCMDTYNDVDSLNHLWLENPKWRVWK